MEIYIWCSSFDNVQIKNAVLKASVEEVLGGNFIFDKTLLAPITQSTFYDDITERVMRHQIAEQCVVKLKVHTKECRGVETNLPRFPSACTVTVLRAPKVGPGKEEDWG